MIAVRDHLDQLGDTLPVVITFADDPSRLTAYRTYLDLEFPVVADVDRTLYRLLGAGRGSFFRVWSPGTIAMYARLVRRGRRLHAPTEDTRQLGADAVIDRDGRSTASGSHPPPTHGLPSTRSSTQCGNSTDDETEGRPGPVHRAVRQCRHTRLASRLRAALTRPM